MAEITTLQKKSFRIPMPSTMMTIAINGEAITLHKAAKETFEQLGLQKLPRVKELNAEYGRLQNWLTADIIQQ